MRRYLIKADPHKNRCNGSSENYEGRTAKGELQREKSVDDNRWE